MTVETIMHNGEEKIILSPTDYQDLIDARDHAIAMREVAAGAPTLTSAELDEFLAAKTPLTFWRRRAGLTQSALAAKIGVSQAFLAQLERGQRRGTVDVYLKLAPVFGLRVEDLVNSDDHA
jgi:DNA-binding XRE family transcriptional regulator